MYCLFCDVPCIVCVYVCTEQLPLGGYPIAVKYIISYIKPFIPRFHYVYPVYVCVCFPFAVFISHPNNCCYYLPSSSSSSSSFTLKRNSSQPPPTYISFVLFTLLPLYLSFFPYPFCLSFPHHPAPSPLLFLHSCFSGTCLWVLGTYCHMLHSSTEVQSSIMPSSCIVVEHNRNGLLLICIWLILPISHLRYTLVFYVELWQNCREQSESNASCFFIKCCL